MEDEILAVADLILVACLLLIVRLVGCLLLIVKLVGCLLIVPWERNVNTIDGSASALVNILGLNDDRPLIFQPGMILSYV